MTLNAEELRKAATPLYEADLKAIPEQFSELLERYSMVPKEEQINHVLTLRNRAYELKAYPCLGRFRFLELDLSNHPLYPDVLRKLRAEDQDELFLDFGCCIGQDVRKLIFDGAPVSKVYGSDLLPDFVKTGYELFRDENTLSRDHWIAPADAFDESEGNALAQLEGKITILHVSAVFHLFGLEQQRQLARRCLRLLSRNTNCLVMGGQTANVEAGEYPRAAGTLRWRHNSQSWADLWEETAKNNGRCKVEAHSALAERLLGKGTKDDLGDRQSDEDERKKVIGRHEEGFRWMTWWTWVQFEG